MKRNGPRIRALLHQYRCCACGKCKGWLFRMERISLYFLRSWIVGTAISAWEWTPYQFKGMGAPESSSISEGVLCSQLSAPGEVSRRRYTPSRSWISCRSGIASINKTRQKAGKNEWDLRICADYTYEDTPACFHLLSINLSDKSGIGLILGSADTASSDSRVFKLLGTFEAYWKRPLDCAEAINAGTSEIGEKYLYIRSSNIKILFLN